MRSWVLVIAIRGTARMPSTSLWTPLVRDATSHASMAAMTERAKRILGALCVLGVASGGCESPSPREERPPAEQRGADSDRHTLVTPAGAFEAAFPGWTWATLTTRQREAAAAEIAGISEEGPPAWVSLRRAREACLDAIRAGEVFGAETLAIVVGELDGFEGEGLSLDQGESLVATARDVVSDRMTRLRFRELKDEKEEARKAAASLGVSPTTEALAEFSSLFEAPMVLSMSIKVRFVAAEGDPELVGHLAGRGQALVYHRSTGTVLARVQVRIGDPKPLGQATSLARAADEVARELGSSLADDLSCRLFERLYSNR